MEKNHITVLEKPGYELPDEFWKELLLQVPTIEILLIQSLSLEENFLNLN